MALARALLDTLEGAGSRVRRTLVSLTAGGLCSPWGRAVLPPMITLELGVGWKVAERWSSMGRFGFGPTMARLAVTFQRDGQHHA